MAKNMSKPVSSTPMPSANLKRLKGGKGPAPKTVGALKGGPGKLSPTGGALKGLTPKQAPTSGKRVKHNH